MVNNGHPGVSIRCILRKGRVSYVGTLHAAAGFAFGPDGSNMTQARFVLESGFLF